MSTQNARGASTRYGWLYGCLAALIVVALAVIGVMALTEREVAKPLPAEFRLSRPRLSNLPVSIDQVISCSCWHGPRGQAERKYKFRVINDSGDLLNIGGGTSSQIRLLIAYPRSRHPAMTFPRATSDDVYERFATPDDIDLRVASDVKTVQPSRLIGSNALFGVPRDYAIWALPPVPNRLAEIVDSSGDAGNGTFPTVVDNTHLLPGAGYSSRRRGHGTWTFYVPLPPRLAKEASGPYQIVIPDSEIEKYMIFVGIGAFAPQGRTVADLLGFAPAPSDAALEDPSEF